MKKIYTQSAFFPILGFLLAAVCPFISENDYDPRLLVILAMSGLGITVYSMENFKRINELEKEIKELKKQEKGLDPTEETRRKIAKLSRKDS